MHSKIKNTQPLSLFFLLYFFEGAPMGLIWWTIPAILASQGFSVEEIATLAATATIPWSIKFILGPVTDRYVTSVRQHAWTIAVLQIGMALGITSLLIVSMESSLVLWCVLLISVFSASQDVVIDAWAIASIPADQKGKANGAMQAGMLTGRWLFGAGLLVALAYIEYDQALYILIGLTTLSICFLFINFRSQAQVISPTKNTLSFKSFKFIIEKKYIILAFVALTTGFTLEGFTSVISPFLINYGLDIGQTGWVLSLTLLAMLTGSVGGGLVVDWVGDTFSFYLSGLLLAASVLLAGLAFNLSVVFFVISVLSSYVFVGFFTASSYTYYMNKSKGHMEASKFTFLMAITNLCEVVAVFSMGKMITQLDLTYFTSFLVCTAIGLMGLLLVKNQNSKQERLDFMSGLNKSGHIGEP